MCTCVCSCMYGVYLVHVCSCMCGLDMYMCVLVYVWGLSGTRVLVCVGSKCVLVHEWCLSVYMCARVCV